MFLFNLWGNKSSQWSKKAAKYQSYCRASQLLRPDIEHTAPVVSLWCLSLIHARVTAIALLLCECVCVCAFVSDTPLQGLAASLDISIFYLDMNLMIGLQQIVSRSLHIAVRFVYIYCCHTICFLPFMYIQ